MRSQGQIQKITGGFNIMGRPRQNPEAVPETKKKTETAAKKEKAPRPPVKEKEAEKRKEIACGKTDCEFFDAAFPGNCITGPVPEDECQSYMKAEGLPKVESSLMVGSILMVPMDREPGMVDWLGSLPNAKMRLVGALIKNMLECQMDLDRFPLREKAVPQGKREAA